MKRLYIDIESLEKGNPRKGDKPIDIITYWCDGCYHVFVWQPVKVKPVYEGDPVIVHIAATEPEMFREFMEQFITDDPDLILAWNVDYDVSYIIKRMERLGLDPNRLSPFGQSYVGRDGAKIKGRLMADLLEIYRDSRSAYSSNALADVVCDEYGIEKDERYEEAKQDPNILVELNLQHVWLHKKLDEDFGLSDFYIGIYYQTGYNPFDVYNAKSFVDYFMLTVRNEGEYLPMPREAKGRKTYRAAIVFDPLVGLHRNVANVDFSRMYPSIMLAFNISPDTIVLYGEGDINYKSDTVKVGFRTDKLGLIPRAILTAFKARDEIDKAIANETDLEKLKILKNKKQAIKGLINSFYGVFAYPKFRLYDERIAKTVVSIARELLVYTKQQAEKWGFTVCYGDTDSVFIKNDNNLQNMVDSVNEFVSTLTFEFLEKYGNVDWKCIKVDFEKLYSRILFIAKKRYAGYVVWEGEWLPEPYLDITGLEYVRSDYPKFTKELQKAVLEKALFGTSKHEIIEYIEKQWKWLVKNGKPFDFAFKERITKPISEYKVRSEHIKAAINSNRLFGMEFNVGDAVYYVYVKGGPRVVAVNRKMDKLPWKIDYEKHFERMVKNPIEPIIGNIHSGKVRGLEAWVR